MLKKELEEMFGSSSDSEDRIEGLCDAWTPEPYRLAFFREDAAGVRDIVNGNPLTTFFVPLGADWPENCIEAANPRLAFAVASRAIADSGAECAEVSPHALVSDGASIGANVSIGPFSVIDDDVVIGAGTRIGSHVHIRSGVTLGEQCRIGNHVAIGQEGFGFEVDESGTPVRIAHVGGVVIGDRVEVGCHVSIAQGTLKPTTIGDDVKIDDCCFIAHNVIIGEGSFVIAGSSICGSAQIGSGAWISPESTIINKAKIGNRALVGLGAVVVSNVDPGVVVAGVPAKPRGPRS